MRWVIYPQSKIRMQCVENEFDLVEVLSFDNKFHAKQFIDILGGYRKVARILSIKPELFLNALEQQKGDIYKKIIHHLNRLRMKIPIYFNFGLYKGIKIVKEVIFITQGHRLIERYHSLDYRYDNFHKNFSILGSCDSLSELRRSIDYHDRFTDGNRKRYRYLKDYCPNDRDKKIEYFNEYYPLRHKTPIVYRGKTREHEVSTFCLSPFRSSLPIRGEITSDCFFNSSIRIVS